jgi:hypothetical protein
MVMMHHTQVPLEWAAPFMDRFLQPAETNATLIELQLLALLGRKITPERNPLLYRLAVHHVSTHLFSPRSHIDVVVEAQDASSSSSGAEPRGALDVAGLARAAAASQDGSNDVKTAAALNRKHTAAMVEQLIVVATDEVYSDVVFYEGVSLSSGGTTDGPRHLDGTRREVLLGVASAAPRLAAMLERRHPDLITEPKS